MVVPAAILHDVGWFNVPASVMEEWRATMHHDHAISRIHERESVKIAEGVLAEVGYDGSLVSEILRIIDCHDTGGPPRSVDEEIVRAADVLWRYSRDGFGVLIRLFSYEPAQILEELELALEEWFSVPLYRQMAEEALEERKREFATDHLGTD